MNMQGSGMAQRKTMTGIVGGVLVLPVVWKCWKTKPKPRPKPRPFCRMNRATLPQSDLNRKTFPLPRGQFRKSGLSNPHRLA